ncbi:hypothetical protein MJ390_25115 [Klebsiella pneumoniae]|nr:hypothetical protein MJ390_25115 [Klebsiella pneumoniae]
MAGSWHLRNERNIKLRAFLASIIQNGLIVGSQIALEAMTRPTTSAASCA